MKLYHLQHIVPFIAHSIIPLLLIAFLWRNPKLSIKSWLFKVSFTVLYLLDLHISGFLLVYALGYLGSYFILILLILSIPGSFVLLMKHRKKLTPQACSKTKIIRGKIVSFLLIITALFLSWEVLTAISASRIPTNLFQLKFPLEKGAYLVLQGGGSILINHHYPVRAQRFALDIVKLNKWGLRSKKIFPSELSDYNIYGEEVFAPVTGKVIKLVQNCPDRNFNATSSFGPAGNHVFLQTNDHAIVFAHLQKGSIQVKEGESVHEGQLIGKVGNSGNSTEPHLHIHSIALNDDGEYLYEAEGIPMLFDQTYLVKNKIYLAN
ncbi:hypothetical protein COB11_05790 [Candidatus Aerophobetes bacterium]|uniref:M23ase beta-sheet core domain-containing protein n=1 Tax=Aerophobetes bacterium TaxID=2030807 RepID=A0A2A4YEL4_UNCAE|nr:MAG: hypothetical protein COB11_05790 [Candidatus Aerophobetes bacterium]